MLGSDPVERCRQRTMNVEGGDGSTLSLDFTTGVLDPRLTFIRNSTATYINSSGYVTTIGAAPTNDPTKARFDYDPTTLAPRGLLIEASTNNLVTRSQALNTSPWVKPAAVSISETGNGSPANDSTSNVLTWTNGTAVESAYTEQPGIAVSASQPYTWSVWLKNRGNQRVSVFGFTKTSASAFAGNLEMTVDFSVATPTAAITTSTNFTNTSATTPVAYPNGWYRCTMTGTTPATAATTGFGISNKDAVPASGTNGCEAWGAQLEASSGASSYMPTVASTANRVADFCTMPTSLFITGALYPQTLFVDCIPANPSAAFPDIVRLFDRTAGGAFSYGTEIYYYGSSTMAAQRKTIASTSSDRPLASGLSYNSRHKFAISVDSSAFLGSYDGLTGTGTTTAPPALATQVTHMGVGCTGDTTASSVMFGTIRQIKFFPFAMVQSQLNAVTTL